MAIRRIEVLEGQQRAMSALEADDRAAQRMAQERGFAVEVLRLPDRVAERRTLAGELRKKGWSFERIGRVLRVSEKTVRRWDVRTPGE